MTYLLIILLHIIPADTAKVDTVKKWNYPITRTVVRDSTKQQQTVDKLDDIINKLKQKKHGNNSINTR